MPKQPEDCVPDEIGAYRQFGAIPKSDMRRTKIGFNHQKNRPVVIICKDGTTYKRKVGKRMLAKHHKAAIAAA